MKLYEIIWKKNNDNYMKMYGNYMKLYEII